jgi:DNA-binding transcriptional LysR family regulator
MLEIFRAVMVHGGISAAARAIHVAQPAISRTIAELERATGLALFVKRGRHAVPTEDAVALHAQVDRSFIGLQEILRHAQLLREHRTGWVTLACLPALAHTVVPGVIARLRERLPHTAVRLQVASSHAVAQLVASRQCELGLSAAGVYSREVERLGRLQGECCCILPAGHRLASRRSIEVEQLAREPLVQLAAASPIRQALDALLGAHACTPQIVAETAQSASASQLVMQAIGVAVVDPFSAADHVRRGGHALRLKPGLPYAVDLIAHGDLRPGEAVRTLVALLNPSASARTRASV